MVRIGFERTFEQDVAFGVRQLADIAVKALSAAISDRYTVTRSSSPSRRSSRREWQRCASAIAAQTSQAGLPW